MLLVNLAFIQSGAEVTRGSRIVEISDLTVLSPSKMYIEVIHVFRVRIVPIVSIS